MNVTPEVSVVDVIRALSNYSKDETFVAAIESAKENKEIVKMILLHSLQAHLMNKTPMLN